MPYLNEYLSDHPSLVGIIRFPNCSYTTQEINIPVVTKNESTGVWYQKLIPTTIAKTITPISVESEVYNIAKDEATDFYPYTYYVLTDGECEPLIMHPQYLPKELTIKGKFALSNTPVERYYPSKYKSDTTGNIYNITNTNIMTLPTATNEGMAYLNANSNLLATTGQNLNTQGSYGGAQLLLGAGLLGSGLLTGNAPLAVGGISAATAGLGSYFSGVNSLSSTYQTAHQAMASNRDKLMTPPSLSSFGNPSTRRAFTTDNVKILKCAIDNNQKEKVREFYAMYGYKYNRRASNFDFKSYTGYLKANSIVIGGGIDNMFKNKITEILSNGTYIE